MAFTRPTLQQIVDRIITDIESRIEGANTLLRRSVLRVLGRVYAGAVHLLYGYLSYIKDQMFATTADTDNLEIIGSEFGITRKAPTKATGSATATGTNGVTIPAGTQLELDEQVYIIDNTVVIVGGVAIIDLTAQEGGSDGNSEPLSVLSFVSPIAGVDSTATVDAFGLTGGVDEESDDELRARTIARKRQPPHGGAAFDYVAWAKEVSGVTRAWVISQYRGPGTAGVAFARDNDPNTIIPTSAQIEEVRQYLIQHVDPLTGVDVGIPIGAEEGLFMIEPTLFSQDFAIDIYPNTVAIQQAIQSSLDDLLFIEGGPGETLYISEMIVAISAAQGLVMHRLVSPANDVAFPTNRVPVLGTVMFGDY